MSRMSLEERAARCAALLEQGAKLAAELTPEAFVWRPGDLAGGGVGAQLRHCADFHACLLRDLPAGVVDYDRRVRDPRLERDPLRAASQLRQLAAAVSPAVGRGPDRRLRVRSEEADAAGWVDSSLARELQFLASHTVHHYALVAWLLRAQGRAVQEGLGVAPSTLAHWREQVERTLVVGR